MRLQILTLFTILAFGSLSQTKVDVVKIEPYKVLSYGAFFKSLTLHSEDTHADYIDGFEFEWGYIYELKVKSEKLKNPLEDGGDTDYTLIKEVSKTKAPADYRFELRLENEVYLGGDSANAFEKIDDNTYKYLREVEIIVPDNLLLAFDQIISNGKFKKGVFTFNEGGSIQLIEIK